MNEFDDIAKINARGTTLINGLTASIREGSLMPAPGGGFNVSPPPPPMPGPDGRPAIAPEAQSHVLVGSSLLASFEPGERAEAQELVDEINKSLEGLRKKLKGRFMEDLRKIIGSK